MLVGQHDAGIADADFGMVDLAARIRQAHDLLGAECFLVEGNGVAGAAQNQIRGHSVMTLGDRFHCSGHIGLPLAVVLGALRSMAFP